MFSNESESATWNRYDRPGFDTLIPWLPIAASVGAWATLVASNNGDTAIGAVTFRLEPSAFNAADDWPTALGDAGDCTPSLHAMATVAHTTTATYFNLIRCCISSSI